MKDVGMDSTRGWQIDPVIDSIDTNAGIVIGLILLWQDGYFVSILYVPQVAHPEH